MFKLSWQISEQIKNWLPKLQSHRGYCQTGLPENTLQSIQKAVELGYKMVEFDVHLTKDFEIILFHDDFISINGEIRLIQDLTLHDLKKVVFVNRLQEILVWLQELADPSIKLNIELKTAEIFNSSLERKLIELIHDHKVQKQILISSFNPLALARIRFIDSSIFRALLVTYEKIPQNKWYLKKMIFNVFCKPHVLHLFHENWDRKELKKLKLKVPVVLWTYNGSLTDLDFKDIHGIISDKITPENFNRH